VIFPVTLQSGQYVELESIDDCVLYDERGELISRFRPQVEKLPLLAEGANAIRFGCAPPQGHSARAEVTVVSLGQPFGDRRPEAEIDWKRLDREYDIPRIVTRFDGADNVWNIVRRLDAPGGQEKPPVLEIELAVPRVPNLRTKPGPRRAGLPRGADAGDRRSSGAFPRAADSRPALICRDQATWRVLSADDAEVAAAKWRVPSHALARRQPSHAQFPNEARRGFPCDCEDREGLSLTGNEEPVSDQAYADNE